MKKSPLKIAIANIETKKDVVSNSKKICAVMTEAKNHGAHIVQFSEAALSGYIKSQISDWADVNWRLLKKQLDLICTHAKNLQIYIILGSNHFEKNEKRPKNSVYIISPEGVIVTRYDKRYCSHTEISSWYSAGHKPCVFEVGGWKLGCAICIEIQFPSVFSEYEALDVDCVFLSTYSNDPMHWIQSQGHAACNNIWISVATPKQCSDGLQGGLVKPNGKSGARVAPESSESHIMVTLDQADPELDISLNKARPWRRLARSKNIYDNEI